MWALLLLSVNVASVNSFSYGANTTTTARGYGYECKDSVGDCPLWRHYDDQCVTDLDIHKKCPLTCKFCRPGIPTTTPPPTTPCVDQESREYCTTHILYCFVFPDLMEARCSHTCGFCHQDETSSGETQGTCFDANGEVYCKQVEQYCSRVPALMEVQCKKTCKFCGEICNTGGCQRTAQRILSNIDASHDPCEDFYDYACGGWHEKRDGSFSSMNEDNFAALKVSVLTTLQLLLEQPYEKEERQFVRKAKDFYVKCMDIEQLDKQGTERLASFYADTFPEVPLDFALRYYVPSFNLTQIAIEMNKLDIEALFRLDVYKEGSSHRMKISPPEFHLLPVDHYTSPSEHSRACREAYRKRISRTLELLGWEEKRRSYVAEDILRFERESLATFVDPTDREVEKMTLDEFYGNYSFIMNDTTWGAGEPFSYDPLSNDRMNDTTWVAEEVFHFKPRRTDNMDIPIIDWRSIFEGIYGLETINNVSQIHVKSPSYFRQLGHYLSSVNLLPRRLLKVYMEWHIIAELSQYLSEPFRQVIRDYENVLRGYKRIHKPRYHTCVEETIKYLGLAIGRMYVDSGMFQEAEKKEVEDMVEMLKSAFNTLSLRSTWNQQLSEHGVRWRIPLPRTDVGYEDAIRNNTWMRDYYRYALNTSVSLFANVVSAKREMFQRKLNDAPPYTFPHSTSAHVFHNKVVFPAGLLQPPLFDSEAPKSVNYGSLGMIMAKTLSGTTLTDVHRGRLRLNIHKQKEDFYSAESTWVDCELNSGRKGDPTLRDCYDYSKVLWNNNRNRRGDKGKVSVDEAFMYQAGLEQSLKAYRDYVGSLGKEENPIQGLNYTHNQLFFLSFAQTLCDRKGKTTPGGPYSNKFRVIGPLQNSLEFREAFQCRRGTYMYRDQRSKAW